MSWRHLIGLVLLIGSVALFRIYLESRMRDDGIIIVVQMGYTFAIMASTYLLEVE